MMRLLGEYRDFFREFRTQFETTGAIAPSSRVLAAALTGPLRSRQGPVRVLEVGPGTGAVTRRIVSVLQQGDRLDLVELNDNFIAGLHRLFAEIEDFRLVRDFSTIHACALQDFAAEQPYDFIISGLPLNNFSVALAEEIFESFRRLLAPQGVLSYFEYMYVRSVRKRIGKHSERARLAELDRLLQGYLDRHRISCDRIFFNLPPAWVQHLQMNPDQTMAQAS